MPTEIKRFTCMSNKIQQLLGAFEKKIHIHNGVAVYCDLGLFASKRNIEYFKEYCFKHNNKLHFCQHSDFS